MLLELRFFLRYSRLLLQSDGFNAVSPIDRASKIGRFQTHTSSTSHTFLNGNRGHRMLAGAYQCTAS